MAGRARVGSAGESVAARYLERLGYVVRERNFRCAHGEVDLIASTEEYLVFVEVKTRSRRTPYDPTLAVTEDKKQRVRRLGEFYCAEQGEQRLQPRFDVVAVTLGGGRITNDATTRGDHADAHVEHYIDAF